MSVDCGGGEWVVDLSQHIPHACIYILYIYYIYTLTGDVEQAEEGLPAGPQRDHALVQDANEFRRDVVPVHLHIECECACAEQPSPEQNRTWVGGYARQSHLLLNTLRRHAIAAGIVTSPRHAPSSIRAWSSSASAMMG